VDFATAASQNGFNSYKLFIHMKTNIIFKKLLKNFKFFIPVIFYYRAIVKKDHSFTFIELCEHCYVMRRCKIHRYLAAPFPSRLDVDMQYDNKRHKKSKGAIPVKGVITNPPNSGYDSVQVGPFGGLWMT
jgi:hypothetical protein